MITTGGTIASIQTKDGLKPGLDGNQLLEFIPQLNNMCNIDVKSVFSIDSTNVYYKHWLILAEVIKEEYDNSKSENIDYSDVSQEDVEEEEDSRETGFRRRTRHKDFSDRNQNRR